MWDFIWPNGKFIDDRILKKLPLIKTCIFILNIYISISFSFIYIHINLESGAESGGEEEKDTCKWVY